MQSRDTNAGQAHDVFKALGSETRIRIVEALREQALCVGALAARLQMTESAVSQHLRVLRTAGLVVSDKRANFVHYRLSPHAERMCEAAIREVLGRGAAGD
jgi:ArsR family transcriptional regulator